MQWVRPVVRHKKRWEANKLGMGASGVAAPGSRFHGTSKWTEKQIGLFEQKKISNFCG